MFALNSFAIAATRAFLRLPASLAPSGHAAARSTIGSRARHADDRSLSARLFANRRLRSLAQSALALALLWPAPGRAGELAALLEARRCQVVDLLRQIHAHPDPTDQQNRFLILAREDKPQDYVQCAFDHLDRRMLCEAASGYFFDVPRTMHLAPARIAALGRLGFSTNDAAPQNFRLTLALADPPNLKLVADLMLAALYLGYDVRDDTELTVTAPDAKQTEACEDGAAPPIRGLRP